jgi:hypothetical protein
MWRTFSLYVAGLFWPPCLLQVFLYKVSLYDYLSVFMYGEVPQALKQFLGVNSWHKTFGAEMCKKQRESYG